jgi:hypothetical protein
VAKPRPDFDQHADLKREIVQTFAKQGVVRVEPVIAFSPPFDYWLWLGTTTDHERDQLRSNGGVAVRLAELTRLYGPADGAFEGFTVESQETVDREYEGSWFYRLR